MVIEGFKYWTMGFPCNPGPFHPDRDTILINRKPVMMGPDGPSSGHPTIERLTER